MLRYFFNKSKNVLQENKEVLYTIGVSTSVLSGASYGGYKMLKATEDRDFYENTFMTTFGVLSGGCAGLIGWLILPIVIPVAGVVCLHKINKNEKK